tara:strand:- start:52 stop:333 length:282 start_codon:yes stop_codon:yes gene_type:complete
MLGTDGYAPVIWKKLNLEKNISGTFNYSAIKSEKLINIIFYVKSFYKSNSKIQFVKNDIIMPYISSKKIVSKFNLKLPSTISIIKDALGKNSL